MNYNDFKNIIDKKLGKVNSKSPDEIATAISNAYELCCYKTCGTIFKSFVVSNTANARKDLKKSLVNSLNSIAKCTDNNNTKIYWTNISVAFLNFWKTVLFTPGMPAPPCVGPITGPPDSSGTKVFGGEINKLADKLFEISGKYKDNFNEWIDLLFDALVNFHLSLFGIYYGMQIVGFAMVPLNIPWKGIFANGSSPSRNKKPQKVQPSGGRGSELSIIKNFEWDYHQYPVEWVVVTTYNGVPIVSPTTNNSKGSVGVPSYIDDIGKWDVADLIMSHNHPLQVTKDGTLLAIGGGLSDADIVCSIYYNYYELRAVDPIYRYIIQRPSEGWYSLMQKDFKKEDSSGIVDFFKMKNPRIKPETLDLIYSKYEQKYDQVADEIFSDSRKSSKLINNLKKLLDDNDIKYLEQWSKQIDYEAVVAHMEGTHSASSYVCNLLGARYERVLRKKFE